MPKQGLACLAATVLVSGSAIAQEQSATQYFNVAWQAYTAAAETRDPILILEAAERAYAAGEELLDENDERYAAVALNYGTSLLAAGQTEHARDFIDLALQRYEGQAGPDSPVLIPVYFRAADACDDDDQSGEKSAYLERALQISKKNDGEASIKYANVLLRAGKSLSQGPRSPTAKKYLTSAYDSYALHLGKDTLQAGEAAYHLGLIAFNDQKYRIAESHFRAALGGFNDSNPIVLRRQLMTREMLVQTYEYLGDSGNATEHCIAIGQMNAQEQKQVHKPLFSFAASYPIKMLAKRQEGFVDVGFKVDERGFVRDARVLKTSGHSSFEQAALNAVVRFRYAPTFVNGNAIETEHVRTRITFRLD